MESFGILNSGKFQFGWFTGCMYSVAADFFSCLIIADCFQFTRFECYVVKSKEEIVLAFAFTQRFTIQEKFHLFPGRYHMYGFYCIFRIIPVSDNVGLVFFRIYPSVPHHLMCIEGVFLNTHSICHSTSAIVFRSPVMGIGVREDNFSAAGADPVTCSGTLTPIIIPAGYHGNGKFILVTVIISGRFTFIERTVTLLMERITVFIPIFS